MEIPFRKDDALAVGAVEWVAPGVRRILCGNPGPYTFRGTNTWLVGKGRSVAVLDPGPADPAHLAAILAATKGEQITHIVLTHTHRDHSAGLAALKAACGAPAYAFGPHQTPPEQASEGADHDFRPDIAVGDGESIRGEGWVLTALHTPGHCSNHLCFALADQGLLFSGDHVMAWSTTVISPPDGDMAAYLASLERLMKRQDRLLLPGHGPPLPDPQPFMAALMAHRQAREKMVLTALRATGWARPEDLVPAVYGSALAPQLGAAAARSVAAHLIKLAAEGYVEGDGLGWRPR